MFNSGFRNLSKFEFIVQCYTATGDCCTGLFLAIGCTDLAYTRVYYSNYATLYAYSRWYSLIP